MTREEFRSELEWEVEDPNHPLIFEVNWMSKGVVTLEDAIEYYEKKFKFCKASMTETLVDPSMLQKMSRQDRIRFNDWMIEKKKQMDEKKSQPKKNIVIDEEKKQKCIYERNDGMDVKDEDGDEEANLRESTRGYNKRDNHDEFSNSVQPSGLKIRRPKGQYQGTGSAGANSLKRTFEDWLYLEKN